MNSFFEMDWSAKCEWENLVMFSSKASESSTKLHSMDWGIEDEVEINAGSFNLSGWGGDSDGSGSDVQHGSSAKSSISASTYSYSKEGMKASNFSFEAFEGFLGDFSKKKSATIELTGSSSPVEASVGSVEPLIGLKLGKRTYFEDNYGASNIKTSSLSTIPVSSATTKKKIKSSCHNPPIAHCQVEGCNLDLSSAKDYHRRHKVCESHSKSPKVIVGGLERRFCQQCSRFHSLSEFDAKKRSCHRRLSDHNARRRKPQQEAIQFNSTGLASSFYDGRQQINFLSNNSPPFQRRPSGSLIWETSSSKFTLTKDYASKPEKAGIIDGRPHLRGIQLQNTSTECSDDSNRLVTSMDKVVDSSNQGFKGLMLSFNSDAALDYCHALSLLSTDSSSSCPVSITLDNPLEVAHTNEPPHYVDLVPRELLNASSEYWQIGQQLNERTIPTTRSGIQEIKHLKSPYATE